MPRTLFDKIWDAHVAARRADGRDLLYMDRHVLHDLHAPHAFERLEATGRGVRRPDLTFAVQDHTVATSPGPDDTTFPQGPPCTRPVREGTLKRGRPLFDIADPEHAHSDV